MIGNKEQILNYLEKDKDWDIYECTRKQKKSIRSLLQNNYYFWVVVPIISDFHWFNTIETHELIKGMFKIKTTTWLNTSEFKWFMEQIIDIWKVRYNVTIPLPSWWLEEQNLFNTN